MREADRPDRMNHALPPHSTGRNRRSRRAVSSAEIDGWCFIAAPPAPTGGGGQGGGGAPTTVPSGPRGRAHRRAARGGAAPPNEGRGRTTAPGTSAGSPTRRAAPVRRTPNQTKRLSFVRLVGDWAPGQLLTKLAFCWVRPVVAAAELWRRCAPLRISGKSSEKRVMGR